MGAPLAHPGHHRERRLRARERLHLALLIHAQHDRRLGRVQVQADDVVDLLHEQRVVGELERVGAVRLAARTPARSARSSTPTAPSARPSSPATSASRSPAWTPSVATTTSSTCSAVIVAGRPGRGSSDSPSNRSSQNRRRHFPTVARRHPTRRRHLLVRPPLRALQNDPRAQRQRLRGLPPTLPPHQLLTLGVSQLQHLLGTSSSCHATAYHTYATNLRRRTLGDVLAELPTGRPYDVERCVIARAVDAGHCVVEDDLLTLHSRTNEHGDSWITGLPWYVSAFLEAFDAGAYPGLSESRLAS